MKIHAKLCLLSFLVIIPLVSCSSPSQNPTAVSPTVMNMKQPTNPQEISMLPPTTEPPSISTPQPTPAPEPVSGICILWDNYREGLNLDFLDHISAVDFKLDGKEMVAFLLRSAYEDAGISYSDVFTGIVFYHDQWDPKKNDYVHKLYHYENSIKGEFEEVREYTLVEYLNLNGMRISISELGNQIQTYGDLRKLYEKIVPKAQWFRMPWNTVPNFAPDIDKVVLYLNSKNANDPGTFSDVTNIQDSDLGAALGIEAKYYQENVNWFSALRQFIGYDEATGKFYEKSWDEFANGLS